MITSTRLLNLRSFGPAWGSDPPLAVGSRGAVRKLHLRTIARFFLPRRERIRRTLPPPNPNGERQCDKSALIGTGRSPSPLAWLTVDPKRANGPAAERSFILQKAVAERLICSRHFASHDTGHLNMDADCRQAGSVERGIKALGISRCCRYQSRPLSRVRHRSLRQRAPS